MLKLHYNLEKVSMGLVGAIAVVASIGGIVEIAPLFTIEQTVEIPDDMRPHTPLELAGRELYIREGCYACWGARNAPALISPAWGGSTPMTGMWRT